MLARRIIPDVINNQDLKAITPRDTVLAASIIMADNNISAILVIDDIKLVGLLSSNDLTQRIVAKSKVPGNTLVGDVMTMELVTISPSDTARDALNLMRDQKCRHLPVVEGTKCVGIVSIRDLYSAIDSQLQEEVGEAIDYIQHGGTMHLG